METGSSTASVRRRRTPLLRQLVRSPKALIGAIMLLVIVLAAILAPWIVPHDPTAQDITSTLLPPAWMANGNGSYLLGTDVLGRDILSRTIYGARASLLIGAVSVLIASVIGVTIGVIGGFFGGWVEDVMLRIADMQLAIPYILLAILLSAVIGPSVLTVIIVLGITRWVVYARITRGEVLSLKERDFVRAAVGLGARRSRIILRHLLPNLISAILVVATIEVSLVILAEASLSFLGLGVQPPTPTWGTMLGDGRDYLATAWWLSVFPGVALMLAILSLNMLGDWLRDTLDPGLKVDG